MDSIESIEDFYKHKLSWMPENLKKEMGHFNVFRIDEFAGKQVKMPYSRKNYFKISLLGGHYKLSYADKFIEVQKQALIFSNPMIPYTMEPLMDEVTGYFCLFTETFFKEFGNVKDYPIFQPGSMPVFLVSDEQAEPIKVIFNKMLQEIGSDYIYKYDVLRNLVFELVHNTMKMQPVSTPSLYSSSNAATRISSLFMELLERQFPIESPSQQVALQSPSEFASHLSVHVNHLNRALRETAGKTTSRIIAERITQEARSLLRHTNWNVAEIAWCLGFEESAHFINFFKKNTDLSPGTFRSSPLV